MKPLSSLKKVGGVTSSKMNEKRLHEDLEALAKRPRPQLPPDFNSAVWSRIQSREKRSRARGQNWLRALLSALATPQWAAAGFVIALLIGWILGRMTAGPANSPAETRLAASVTGEVIDIAPFYDGQGTDHQHRDYSFDGQRR
jgi:hypothetical protein